MEFLKVRGFCAAPNEARWSQLAPRTQALLIDGAEYCIFKRKGKISLAKEIMDLIGPPISAQEQQLREARALREKQDRAYEESLRIDQERERRKKQEAALDEEARKRGEQTKEQRRKFLAAQYERRFQKT